MTEPRARLIALLTERPEYREAYEHDAEFRSVVQSIANLAPYVLQMAFETSAKHRQIKDRMMQDTMTARLTNPSGFGFPTARA